jgi:hypothetical protein
MLIKLSPVYYNRIQQMFPRKMGYINKNNKRIIKKEGSCSQLQKPLKMGKGLQESPLAGVLADC